jgi:DNA-binding transcriptional LysR family regulator
LAGATKSARSAENVCCESWSRSCLGLRPWCRGPCKEGSDSRKARVSAWRTQAYEDVAAGRIDTALRAEEAPPSLQSEVLFDLDFVCLVGSAQPVRARRFTLKQYLYFSHALVETLEGQQTFPDRARAQLGAKRRVALSLPFFIPALFTIAQTDLSSRYPPKLAQMTAPIARIRVAEPSREIKAFPYFMA